MIAMLTHHFGARRVPRCAGQRKFEGARVSEAARSLVVGIEGHATESAAPGEFLSNIATDAPHLTNAAQHLFDEHPALIERSRALVELVESSGRAVAEHGSATDLAHEIRERGLELLAVLVRHRQRGADLMFLAYNEDLGSAG